MADAVPDDEVVVSRSPGTGEQGHSPRGDGGPTSILDLEARAAVHHALGDATRLRIVDALVLSDRSPSELRALTGAPTNLLAFHLDVLEEAGVIGRRGSHGDRRRRYVVLDHDRLEEVTTAPALHRPVERVAFVCTANSARSPFAAHLWQERTGLPALSAGTDPADRVHPQAVAAARDVGLDLSTVQPTAYHELAETPDLVVSVCDRAHESSPTPSAPQLHWSIPDPVGGSRRSFEAAFADIAARIDRLVAANAAA